MSPITYTRRPRGKLPGASTNTSDAASAAMRDGRHVGTAVASSSARMRGRETRRTGRRMGCIMPCAAGVGQCAVPAGQEPPYTSPRGPATLCHRAINDRRKPLAKITFPVEAGHIMLFARAIGDTNPVYQDAEAAKQSEVRGIIAPPTFPQAVAQFDPDYPLRWRPGEPWFGSGKTPSGVENRPSGGGGLHAEQHFEYHRPLRPGDVLTVETKPGNTWERESKRAGKLTFRERVTEYRDQKGELVVTARSIGVTTERPVEQS